MIKLFYFFTPEITVESLIEQTKILIFMHVSLCVKSVQ